MEQLIEIFKKIPIGVEKNNNHAVFLWRVKTARYNFNS
jgi:hypothetical protein